MLNQSDNVGGLRVVLIEGRERRLTLVVGHVGHPPTSITLARRLGPVVRRNLTFDSQQFGKRLTRSAGHFLPIIRPEAPRCV
jgi:hypothetical protein